MIAAVKAKLRAWLIELVREAVRSEQRSQQNTSPRIPEPDKPVRRLKPAPSDPIQFVPSFEHMQAEALQAQEKYYEPKN